MDKLKCHYCENEETIKVDWTETDCDGTALYQVICRCGARGPWAETQGEAVEAWLCAIQPGVRWQLKGGQ